MITHTPKDILAPVARMAFGPNEAARIIGVSRTTVFEELKAGRLRGIKCGRRTIIAAAELQRWMDALPSREAA